ncbi:hypothetical protein DICVIV_08213 [Dictyocaulus viviparus]|uniref:Uncharacterized protein n=1 Tax=Dictyocaulus viviparus TaxID=29172 RepID=A0A0D8XMA0_DICVI|nr:hypothetical protein DICVIV_08213 [Dictyocaulus viviparus]
MKMFRINVQRDYKNMRSFPRAMAYVPSSEVPSAFIISSDADAVLLDLLGTFILLDGGTQKVLFTKHVRQIDANIISAPTKAALTNAVELNKETVVPLVGNLPPVKKTGKENPVAGLLKQIEMTSEGRPAITPTRFDPKYEPIIISKSLRTGRLEMFVLSGNAKEIEALKMAMDSCDEQTIEKVTAPFGRIISALEKAKALPFLHSPVVSAANAYKEFGPPSKAASLRSTFSSRNALPTSINNTNKPPPSRRPLAPAAPSRANMTNKSVKPPPATVASNRSRVVAPVSSAAKTASTTSRNIASNKKTDRELLNHTNMTNKSVKPPPATVASNRSRVVAPVSSAAKTASTTSRNIASNKKTDRELVNHSNMGAPIRGAATSHHSTPLGGTAGAASATSNHKAVGNADVTPSSPAPLPTVKEMNEGITHTKQADHALSDSVHMLDDVVPEISVDAPQDPVSQHRRSSVELVVIPPTPEPASQSSRSSIDGHCSPGTMQQHADNKEMIDRQPVLVSVDDDGRINSDISPVITSSVPNFSPNNNSVQKSCGHQSPFTASQQLDDEVKCNRSELMSQDNSSFIHESEHIFNSEPQENISVAETMLTSEQENVPKPDKDLLPTTEYSRLPDDYHTLSGSPVNTNCAVAEPFVPPSLTPLRQDVVEGDVPEEFKGPYIPQGAGKNGLLDDLEDPPKLKKISLDTDDSDDLKYVIEILPLLIALRYIQKFDFVTQSWRNNEVESEDFNEAVRKLSQQMINDARSPFTSALASSLVEGAENSKKAVDSVLENMFPQIDTDSCTFVDEARGPKQVMAMQTRSNLMENDESNQAVKYDESDPIIDSVLETVAKDSDRVDHVLSNDVPEPQAEQNGKETMNEVDEEGFRVATDSHQMRLYLPPLSTARGGRAPPVPHLSRPLFFELATVPHIDGKCALADDQSAIEYFTNIRSTNYILHSEDIAPFVLDGWLAGKKHWLNSALKSRLIPTRHHSALQAFVTANATQMEECGLVMNSPLDHNTISLNTEDGREDYHMIKIEL